MAPSDPFLRPELTVDNLDRYLVRRSILDALTAQLPQLHGTFLDVGCGVQPYRTLICAPPGRVERYLGMDLAQSTAAGYKAVRPELEWDGLHIPLDAACVDSAMATEVLEHCPDPMAVLREVERVLVPGGFFFFTVPFLWPLHDVPYDEYRYTPFALERLLMKASFTHVRVQPMGGWDASLAQLLGLWVARRPMGARRRKLLKRLCLPLIRGLIARDHVPDLRSGPMITGLWGVARKHGA